MPIATKETGMTLQQLADREERVFPSYPLVSRYFPATATEDARKRLGRAIERGEGPGLIVGAPGVGKSLLLQVLASQYHDRFDVVLLACARLCTRRALLQAVLFELGLPYKMRDEGELRLSLLDHLLSADECPAGLLLLVDEAHTLPTALLDELRVMTNLIRQGTPRVRLVLAGSAALEESFAHPDLESFSQRLAARCYLAPLGRQEMQQFVRAQIAASNGSPDNLVSSDAWEAMFEATDGVQRLVNQLCDRAVTFAAAENVLQIDRQLVERAWSDLQQLPTPWETPTEPPVEADASAIVEFGGLIDETPPEPETRNSVAGDMDEIEPTELDVDDEIELEECEATIAECPPNIRTSESEFADPFEEAFEEEEVVLDNFAAWDEMFQQELPRVENRRDPCFSTLVQTAIEASPLTGTTRDDASVLEMLRSLSPESSDESQERICEDVDDGMELETVEDDEPEMGNANDSSRPDCPPLRLAVLSEPAALKPIPIIAPSRRAPADDAATDIDAMMTSDWCGSETRSAFAEESPILVVEEERSEHRPHSPVRREKYRNLFSRLRSG